MRRVALVTVALGCIATGGAKAQSLAPSTDSAEILSQAAFAPRTSAVTIDPGARLLDRDDYVPGQGAVVWQSAEMRLSAAGDGPFSTLRVNMGSVLRMPAGLPLNTAPDTLDADRFDVTVVRRWPGAVRFSSEKLAFDIAPHAGLGVSNLGGQAEGGATLTVSKSRGDRALERLKDMGVRDGASFGETGRWYLFAAASGRAVGLNMLRNEHGWDRAGWSTDATGALVGDAHVGVGYRKGDVQSSFGVIHREVKGRHMIFGMQSREDTVAAFTFSLRPQR